MSDWDGADIEDDADDDNVDPFVDDNKHSDAHNLIDEDNSDEYDCDDDDVYSVLIIRHELDGFLTTAAPRNDNFEEASDDDSVANDITTIPQPMPVKLQSRSKKNCVWIQIFRL